MSRNARIGWAVCCILLGGFVAVGSVLHAVNIDTTNPLSVADMVFNVGFGIGGLLVALAGVIIACTIPSERSVGSADGSRSGVPSSR